ncbi:MAG: sterol desaturase family protein [Acetobacteraceae bacterium]
MPWLDRFLSSLLDFFSISVLDPGGRFYWITGIESMLVLAIAYTVWNGIGNGGLRGFLRFCFPKGTYTHRSTLVDYQLNLGNFFINPYVNVAWRFNAAFFTTWLIAALTWAFGPAPHLLSWNWATLLGFTVVLAVLDDFGYWVWHYLCHRVKFLWAFHCVHHSAEVMTPLVAGRVHPVEAVLLPVFRSASTAVVLAAGIYLFIGEATTITVFGMGLVAAVMAAAGDQLFHAHVPISWGDRLNRYIISPATHQIHHSIAPHHHDKNMGAYLAIWDWMFGTLYLPRGETLRFGLAGHEKQIHSNLVTAYLRPVWDATVELHRLTEMARAWLAGMWRQRALRQIAPDPAGTPDAVTTLGAAFPHDPGHR